MRKELFFLLCFSVSLLSFSQNRSADYESYIKKYQSIAQKQQKEHGIPASIILAQGLLESSAGRSELARKANNHFGIKCNDWKGRKVYYDDDHKNECFRKYRRVLDSFEDHSSFIVNRPRYASLFLLSPTDYKGWARGLRKAGYATDPAYARKLISMIETYELHRFDLSTEKKKETCSFAKKKKSTVKDSDLTAVSVLDFQRHKVERQNGLRYVVALPGDTYGSIANEFSLKEKRILEYNDLYPPAVLRPGDRLFLSKKKRQAAKGFLTHTVSNGESLYSIAQFYGLRLEDLFRINNLPKDEQASVGMLLRLRP